MFGRLVRRRRESQKPRKSPAVGWPVAPSDTGPVIYDFGMNNGDDVEYYLLKCDKVVAVEANSSLCDLAGERFASEIKSGRLTILNVALADRESAEPLTFYIHKTNHVLSQL